jgi:hypothetical protein
MNGLALGLVVGLAWLFLPAPVASAENQVWIGLTIYDNPSGKIPNGTVVLVVHEGSPAYEMGVRPGDVLIEIDGRRVVNSSHFICLIAAHVPGETIELSAIRAGTRRTALVTLAERPPGFDVTPHDCSGAVSQTVTGQPKMTNSLPETQALKPIAHTDDRKTCVFSVRPLLTSGNHEA